MAKLSELLSDPDPKKWPKVRRKLWDGYLTHPNRLFFQPKSIYWNSSDHSFYAIGELTLSSGPSPRRHEVRLEYEYDWKIYEEPNQNGDVIDQIFKVIEEKINRDVTKPKVKRWLWAYKEVYGWVIRENYLSDEEFKNQLGHCNQSKFIKLPWSETEFDE